MQVYVQLFGILVLLTVFALCYYQSPYSKEQEEINKNLTDMNLDDI